MLVDPPVLDEVAPAAELGEVVPGDPAQRGVSLSAAHVQHAALGPAAAVGAVVAAELKEAEKRGTDR